MISKAQIKEIRQLHQKKQRDEQGLFIAEGPKVVLDLLMSKFKQNKIYATKEFISNNSNIDCQEINAKELESLSGLSSPNQVLGVFKYKLLTANLIALKQELVLGLDDVRDPGNLGAIIRIADWFGINHIFCSKSCVDVYNPKVVQSTMGSIARVNVYYSDLLETIKVFDNVYGAVLNGESLYACKVPTSGIVIIGNESNGISNDLLEQLTHKITIPSLSSGAESLNAAMATAIICSEFKRIITPKQ